MTAFSFILGVLPLVIASGAGAAARQSLGTAVFAGMIASTVFGVVFIPMLIANWWAVRPLRAGGFGSIYAGAAAENPEEKVAIKVLQRSEHVLDEDIQAFEQESDLSLSLESHPNLAEYIAAGTHEGMHFSVMELIQGVQLKDRVKELGRAMPLEEAIYYSIDVVLALDHLVQSGYLHRDVKPENILIRKDNGLAVLLDYGNCRTLEEALQGEQKSIIGSPHLIAPERLERKPEDVRSDIYSLGFLMYYLVMGSHYAKEGASEDVLKSHKRSIRLPLATKMKGQDPKVVELIDRMIKKRQEERVGSYDEVLQELYAVLAKCHSLKPDGPRVAARRKVFLEAHGPIQVEG
jgi:serine/threonine protein kinase